MRTKYIAALIAAFMLITAPSVFANSDEPDSGDYSTYSALDNLDAEDTTSSRVINTSGTGHVIDNVEDDSEDGEKLQFITVTARDGNVFYIVIDKENTEDNVYFLNTVDETDIAALTEDYTAAEVTPVPTAEPTETAEPTSTAEAEASETSTNSTSGTTIILILALVAAAVIGGYYFKVVIPKKKLEQADDLENFDFGDDAEEPVNEDDLYPDDSEDEE